MIASLHLVHIKPNWSRIFRLYFHVSQQTTEDETLILEFQFQGRNQNRPIPCNCLTMPAREMFPGFFRPLNNLLKVVNVRKWKC